MIDLGLDIGDGFQALGLTMAMASDQVMAMGLDLTTMRDIMAMDGIMDGITDGIMDVALMGGTTDGTTGGTMDTMETMDGMVIMEMVMQEHLTMVIMDLELEVAQLAVRKEEPMVQDL